VNKDYDMVQQGAAPQLQDLYALKEASKISVPTTEQQMMRTLKAFTVLLHTMLGAMNPLTLAFKKEIVDLYDNYQPMVETCIASLRGQPIYTQMVQWVQLRCNACYWNAVVHTVTGVVRVTDFTALFNNIQYKHWNKPNIPKKYLTDPKPAPSKHGGSKGGASRGTTSGAGSRAKPHRTSNEQQRLRNVKFLDQLKDVGFQIGKATTFLRNATPDGKGMATPPKDGRWCDVLLELAHQRPLLESLRAPGLSH
jgi:hypothetical protein